MRASDDAPLVDAAIRSERAYSRRQGSSEILSDPFIGGGVAFATAEDLQNPNPAFASVVATERFVEEVEVAHLFSDTDNAPDPRRIILTYIDDLPVADSGGVTQGRRELVRAVEELAQKLLDAVLLDAPRLHLQVGEPLDWLHGTAPRWLVKPLHRPDVELALTDLSQAERRWSALAATLATHVCQQRAQSPIEDLPLFIILDEPEAHLHRSAEQHMASGLLRWAELLDAYIVVASHSPELLDLPDSIVLQVGRDHETEANAVQPLPAPTIETMAQFGLRPSDLLRRQRIFLLVEGAHDQIVVNKLIGDELHAARVEVLPIRGARQLPATVDSQFLFRFTDAHIIVMLDAVDEAKVRDVWSRAVEVADGDRDAARQILHNGLPRTEAELRWLGEFLSEAIGQGFHNRITPFGLSARDILEYLPVDKLVHGGKSWDQLHAEFATSGAKSFKPWLSKTKAANLTHDEIRDAAQALDRVPHEFVTLANLCRSLSSH